MNGKKAEPNNKTFPDGSRFVFEEPDTTTNTTTAMESSARHPILQSLSIPSPDAFMPRPARPFPISKGDENHRRGNWGNKIEFIFACIAVCTGLRTFKVLPLKLMKNGGGVYLLAYCLALFLILIPYMVLEMALGQFGSSGLISMWRFSPLFKGFGVVAVLYLTLNNVIPNIYSAYHLLYGFYTVTSKTLPWDTCDHAWNTPNCFDRRAGIPSIIPANDSYMSPSESLAESPVYVSRVDPSVEFFSFVIGPRDSPGDLTELGDLKPSLVFTLLATWGFILMWTCLGVKLTGKVAYFLLPAIFILLFAVMIRGATLPGASEGIQFLLAFNWSALGQFDFYYYILNDVFVVGWVGYGIFASLASYNKFHNNFCLDAVLIVVAVIVFIIMVVLVLACYAGFSAHVLGVDVGQVIGVQTPKLVEIMTDLPMAHVWVLVLIALLFLIVLSSTIYVVQAQVTAVLDAFGLPHSWVFLLPTSGVICVISFLVSLPMVTDNGFYVIQCVREFVTDWSAQVFAVVLPLVAVWIYGTMPNWNILRLPLETRCMISFFPRPVQVIFLILWGCVLPCIAMFLLVMRVIDVVQQIPYAVPQWMSYILLAVGIAPVLLIPIGVGLFQLCVHRRNYTFFSMLFWKAAQSSTDWGPANEEHRRECGHSQQLLHNDTSTSYNITPSRQHNFHFSSTSPTSPPGVYTPKAQYSPPPQAATGYPGEEKVTATSPSSTMDKNCSPSSLESAGHPPIVHPSMPPPPPPPESLPPASPATVSITDTVDSSRLYPMASTDYTTDTEQGLPELETSPFLNFSSHETTL